MKKLLALVLALVMSMSLVTISNADFKDADKIDYKEAVDVMNAVGVFIGDEKGNFNAKDNLTREQAAKIIAYLELGEKAADALVGSATFTDVAATRWSAGFVSYCAQAGVVSGNGDGTFAPAGQLTALQFGKMLLVEIGYDAKAAGMVGTDWAINTSKLMATTGLMNGIDGSVNQVLSREKAAQMTLNALKTPTVEYATKGSNITVNGAEINFGASVAKYETSTIAKDQNISSQKLTSGEYTVELGEKLYKDLKKLSTTDAFERSATEWKLKAESIGVYADDADLVYYKGTKIGDIYADLGLSKGISKTKVTMYVNGVAASYTSGTDYGVNSDIVKGNQTKIGGNGVELDVYYDSDTDSVTFVLIETYVGKVAAAYKATSTKDAYVTVSATQADGFTGVGGSFDTESFSKDDIVAYTYSNKAGDRGIQTMYLADKVSGTLSAYTTDGSVTVSGTKYGADKVSARNIKEFSQTVDKGSDVTLYLDANGYALYLDADTSSQYAVVLAYQAGARLDPARVKLLFTDGTTKKVDLDVVKTGTLSSGVVTWAEPSSFTYSDSTTTSATLNKYDIVAYSVNSDNEYELKVVAKGKVVTATTTDIALIKNGATRLETVVAGDRSAYDTIDVNYADGKTIFLTEDVKNKTSYSAYEGIANVPNATLEYTNPATTPKDNKTVVTVFQKDSATTPAATVIFVLNDQDVKMSSGNKDLLFVKGNTDGVSYTKDLGEFYEYTAYLNGEKITLRTDKNNRITAKSLIYGPQYDSKGILNGWEYADGISKAGNTAYTANAYLASADTVIHTVGTDAVSNGTITLGNNLAANTPKTTYAYNKDVKAYMLDVEGNLSATTIDSLALDANDHVWFKLDDDGMIEEIYVGIVDENSSVTPSVGSGISANLAVASGVVTLTVTNGNTTATTAWSAQMKITNTQTGLVSYVDLGSGAAIAANSTATKTLNGNSINLYQAIVTINGTTVVSNQIAG